MVNVPPSWPLVGLALAGFLPSCSAPAPVGVEAEPFLPGGPLVGREIQAYPAGVVPGVQLRWYPTDRDAVFLRAGANLTDRRDWGEHDDESGWGLGGGVGWRRTLGPGFHSAGWHVGARLDLWALEIDWRDPGPRRGMTDIVVLQPTAEIGHGWISERYGRFELTLGLGAEINVDTDGEDVGEGAIALLGFTWIP